ncbi:MAG TPA: M12 family metallo-peptidase [Opitutaceae bacterium]
MTTRSRSLVAASLLGALALGTLGWRLRSSATPDRTTAMDRGSPAATVASTRPALQRASDAKNTEQPNPSDAITGWRAHPPETFTLQLTPDLRVPFRTTKIEQDAHRTTITARIDGAMMEQEGLEGAFLVGTSNAADRWDATVVFPGMEYRIRVRGSEVSIEEAPNEALVCLAEATPGGDSTTTSAATAADLALAATADTPTVDILVLINEQALAERNNDLLRVDADCANYVAASNAVLENSRITAFVWRYLTVLRAPAYTTDNQLETDLESMRRGTALATHIASLKPVYGADQIMMLAGGIKTDAAGYAYVGGTSNLAVMNYPFPTFSNGNRSTVTTSYYTFCHELAHNFGSRHSRANSDSDAVDGDGRYYYGHRINDPQSTSNPIETVGTIMATGSSYRIPYYSHPEITFRGVPIGVAIDQPTAAFNARFLGERAPTMVASASSVDKPAIVRQPTSVQTTAGQPASLTVTATGNGLTYRWTKDGATVANATSSTLSFGALSAAETGTYTVTVSNYLGSVTSDPATVSLTTPVAPAPTTPSTPTTASSGGGGGGGAVSPLFLAALTALAGLRWLVRVRRGA